MDDLTTKPLNLVPEETLRATLEAEGALLLNLSVPDLRRRATGEAIPRAGRMTRSALVHHLWLRRLCSEAGLPLTYAHEWPLSIHLLDGLQDLDIHPPVVPV